MKKYIITLYLFLFLFALGAESALTMSLELNDAIYRGEDDWFFAGMGQASLNLKSPRDPNVQGALVLDFVPVDLSGGSTGEGGASYSYMDVKKAYVKVRFPGLRMTLGKTRLAWGDGVVFNSGDILFGSLNPILDLTRQELRSDTAWLTSLNVPLGPFAFVEGVVLPPGYDASDSSASSVADLSKASAGGRVYFTVFDTKVEMGYLYKGEEKVAIDVIGHRPYLSLQGNIGPDWYMSSSAAFLTEEQRSEGSDADWEDSWNITFGLFHLAEVNRNNTLTFRLETLWFPYQNWESKVDREAVYGVYLYPELTWKRGTSVTFSLQSVVSPLDGSAMITGGAGWNIYQGFTLQAYLSCFTGEDTDTFAWDRGDAWIDGKDTINGVSLITGVRYIY